MSSFLDRLAQRLDAAPDEAERALEAFAEGLHKRVAQKKDVRLPGLGRFYRRDGALAFEPDEALALAANQRFAGLADLTVDVPRHATPPLETSPSKLAPGTAAPFSGDSGPTDALEPDVVDEETEKDDPEEAERNWEASGGAAHPLGTTSDPPIEDADYSLVDAGEAAPDVPSPTQPAPEPLPSQKSEAPSASQKSPSTDIGAKPSVRDPKPPKRSAARPSSDSDVRRWLPWAAAAAVIALLVLLGVLLLSGDRDASEATSPPIVQEDPLEDPAEDVTSESPSEQAQAPTEDPATQPAPSVPDEPEMPEPEEDPSPLYSSGTIDPEAGGYTLVIGSVPQLMQAEWLLSEYRDLGYRAGLLETERDGQVNYRVGVGQFSDRAEAEAVYNDLPSDLPETTWLLRIGSGI